MGAISDKEQVAMPFRSLMPFSGRGGSRADDPFSQLYREVNRAFGDVWRDFGAAGDGAGAIGWTPRVDVKEEESHLVLNAELPGVSEKDVSVTIEGDTLTIAGVKESERQERDDPHGWHVSERVWGSFRRSFALPFEPDHGQVDAHMANGVLTVRLPKPADGKSKAARQIPIRGSAGADRGSGRDGASGSVGEAGGTGGAKVPDVDVGPTS
jgi:HSP20 family protein